MEWTLRETEALTRSLRSELASVLDLPDRSSLIELLHAWDDAAASADKGPDQELARRLRHAFELVGVQRAGLIADQLRRAASMGDLESPADVLRRTLEAITGEEAKDEPLVAILPQLAANVGFVDLPPAVIASHNAIRFLTRRVAGLSLDSLEEPPPRVSGVPILEPENARVLADGLDRISSKLGGWKEAPNTLRRLLESVTQEEFSHDEPWPSLLARLEAIVKQTAASPDAEKGWGRRCNETIRRIRNALLGRPAMPGRAD